MKLPILNILWVKAKRVSNAAAENQLTRKYPSATSLNMLTPSPAADPISVLRSVLNNSQHQNRCLHLHNMI